MSNIAGTEEHDGLDKPFLDVTEDDWKALLAERKNLRASVLHVQRYAFYRIVNILQMMESLVGLTGDEERSSVPVTALDALRQRIHVMRIAHDVCAGDGGDPWSLKAQAGAYIDRMLSSFSNQIVSAIDLADCQVSLNRGQSLCLILNEILLHLGRTGSNPSVTFVGCGPEATLRVSADAWFPAGDPDESEWENTIPGLIQQLARVDLRGGYSFASGPDTGTMWTITVPLADPTAS